MTGLPRPALDPTTGLPTTWAFKPEWEVTPRQTREAMSRPEADRPLLLDCRRDEEWAFNRLEGAVHIPMHTIESRLDEIEEAAGDKTREVHVYCHHGRRSLVVAAQLRGHGFVNAKSVAGGIDLWSMDIDPAVPRY